jgi:threonine/homoserine/homoserine lactone efflux protein
MLETLFAMDPVTIAAFMTAGILLNLTPGADVMFATASGMAGGWRAGIAAAIGITLGGLLHLALAVLGISAAISAIPFAFDVIRYTGAAYLLWLAWKSWTADPAAPHAVGAARFLPAVRRGALTNLLNPKVALFVLAFLPQFTTQTAGPVWQQILILGLIFNATGLVINAGYGLAAGLFHTVLSRVSGGLSKVSAIVFGGLAARLIWE